jgi:hydrogenase maturation protease
MPARILIVAYGNPLRSDDGVAWRAADLLESKLHQPDVEILRLHQLAPELADTAKHFELVLFIDAACVDANGPMPAGSVRVSDLHRESGEAHQPVHFSHVYSPGKILDLARDLYNVRPRAFLITVIGEDFEHGESLSSAVAAAVPEVVAAVEQLMQSSPSKS